MISHPNLLLVAAASVVLGLVCTVVIALDEIRRPQKMPIMNAVWPLTALFGSVVWLAFYYDRGAHLGRQRG